MANVFNLGVISTDEAGTPMMLTAKGAPTAFRPCMNPVTGLDYQVPAGKKFIISHVMYTYTASGYSGRVATADDAAGTGQVDHTANLSSLANVWLELPFYLEVPAGKFIGGNFVHDWAISILGIELDT